MITMIRQIKTVISYEVNDMQATQRRVIIIVLSKATSSSMDKLIVRLMSRTQR